MNWSSFSFGIYIGVMITLGVLYIIEKLKKKESGE